MQQHNARLHSLLPASSQLGRQRSRLDHLAGDAQLRAVGRLGDRQAAVRLHFSKNFAVEEA
jgi:hypothetical protein